MVLNQPLSVNLTLFRSTCRCTPSPRIGKVEGSSSDFQCDILVLADVTPPPPGMEKLKSQVNVTFWSWLMYPPPSEIGIGLNMNAIEQNHFKRGQQVHFTIYPPPLPVPLSDSMPEQETGEFQFQMDMDRWTRTPSTTPLQPKK